MASLLLSYSSYGTDRNVEGEEEEEEDSIDSKGRGEADAVEVVCVDGCVGICVVVGLLLIDKFDKWVVVVVLLVGVGLISQ
tara:strand:- start:62 stop:304 length:243 start_codon:yes stop_codon:yes gene_type:complete